MRRFATILGLAVLAGVGLLVWLAHPASFAERVLPAHEPNQANGERLFHAGGCASCHAEPGDDGVAASPVGGGLAMDTRWGVFHVPNISPDPVNGIGGWSATDFANAMLNGVSPDRRHYYPAFPYPSYTRMRITDVIDLKSYLDTLPVVDRTVPDHELGFPWNLRPGIGLWKLLYLDDDPVAPTGNADELIERGRYLVEGPGHCGECHTPRGVLGGPKPDKWLAGAPALEGKGSAPNITPHEDGLAEWSAADIAYFLKSGFTPDYDIVGGAMVPVQENMSKLPDGDRKAVAAYLEAIQPMASEKE